MGVGVMRRFEFLPDVAVADVAFVAYGRSWGELFAHCAEAVFAQMVELGSVEARVRREVVVSSDSVGGALFDFLSELVFIKDVEGLVFCQFKVEVAEEEGGFHVHADVTGEPVDASRHKLGNDVKAVTLHQFRVERKRGVCEARVVLDI